METDKSDCVAEDLHHIPSEGTIDDSKLQSAHKINSLRILKDINELGPVKEALAAATYRTYLDLCEVRKYESISYHYSTELDLCYIKAKKKPEAEEEIIIPTLAVKSLDFIEVEKLQASFSSNSINLAICDSSSLVMYYKITKS